jgi:SAM-dependent methyltransferase
MFVGGGDFRRSGRRFVGFFREFGKLRPEERVLDVGCGVGRMAAPLTEYLSEKGSYEGFDIVREGIKWCQKAITHRFPNFRFRVADLYNKTYNPKGRFKAIDFPFPYPDESFDFVILTSVFTHMLPADTDHYLAEIARVLSPGGRCFATFFLLNVESLKLIEEGKSSRLMAHALPGCRVDNADVPEDAVGYPEDDARGLLLKHGLEVCEPVRFGKWCGRAEWTSYQDIVIAEKKP